MAGDNNTGGGGSVKWTVHANKVKKTETKDKHTGSDETGNHEQEGRDQDGDPGEKFTVSIKVPAGKTPEQFIREFALTEDAGSRVYFNLLIEKEVSDQIRISWGRGNPNLRPEGELV